jgi:hypothetical protein
VKLIFMIVWGKKRVFCPIQCYGTFFSLVLIIILSSSTLMGKLWLPNVKFLSFVDNFVDISFLCNVESFARWVSWEIKHLRVCRRPFSDKHLYFPFVLLWVCKESLRDNIGIFYSLVLHHVESLQREIGR